MPPHVLRQDDVAAAARRLFAERVEGFDRLARIFGSAGIAKRHAARPIEWYCAPLGWPRRNEAFLEAADVLFADCARRALADARLAGSDVDTVVIATSTGIATPGMEARPPSGFLQSATIEARGWCDAIWHRTIHGEQRCSAQLLSRPWLSPQ